MAFDATDMFMEPFWYMLLHLVEYVSQDKVYSNQLSDELKNAIDNALKDRYVVQVQLVGMHVIENSGPVNEMSWLRDELVVIKNVVDEWYPHLAIFCIRKMIRNLNTEENSIQK